MKRGWVVTTLVFGLPPFVLTQVFSKKFRKRNPSWESRAGVKPRRRRCHPFAPHGYAPKSRSPQSDAVHRERDSDRFSPRAGLRQRGRAEEFGKWRASVSFPSIHDDA